MRTRAFGLNSRDPNLVIKIYKGEKNQLERRRNRDRVTVNVRTRVCAMCVLFVIRFWAIEFGAIRVQSTHHAVCVHHLFYFHWTFNPQLICLRATRCTVFFTSTDWFWKYTLQKSAGKNVKKKSSTHSSIALQKRRKICSMYTEIWISRRWTRLDVDAKRKYIETVAQTLYLQCNTFCRLHVVFIVLSVVVVVFVVSASEGKSLSLSIKCIDVFLAAHHSHEYKQTNCVSPSITIIQTDTYKQKHSLIVCLVGR